MAITQYAHTISPVQVKGNNRLFIAGYTVLGIIALAALYLAAGGPGNGDSALAIMAAMP